MRSPPALASFVGPPHRIELVGDDGGVRWFNDSKATTPHAASVAIRAFDRVVLIAGGLNKGLDLSPMAAEPGRVRAVVAVGEAAGDVSATFAGVAPVVHAASMADAVDRAGGLARPGDVVAAVAGLRQLRLVPRRRLPGARRRLPAARPADDWEGRSPTDDRHDARFAVRRRSPPPGARAAARR